MQDVQLAPLISRICDGSYSPLELLEFVNFSHQIAVSYLKYQEATGKNIRYDRCGINESVEDVAMDCIAGLFMRDENDNFVQLATYFADCLPRLDQMPEELLLVRLRGLVVKKTKQELSRIFRERDPEGAKLLRNVRISLKTAVDLDSFRDMGQEFVFSMLSALSRNYSPEIVLEKQVEVAEVKPAAGESVLGHLANLRRDKLPLDEMILQHEFYQIYSSKDSIATCIRKVLYVIGQHPESQNFVAIDVLVKMLRTVNREMLAVFLASETFSHSPAHDLEMGEIQQASDAAFDFITRKVQRFYVDRQKLPLEKSQIYLNTIGEMMRDMAHGRSTESNFSYLKHNIPNLTQQQYRDEERAVFEYLVKLSKTELIKNFQTLI